MKTWQGVLIAALGIGVLYIGYEAYKDYQGFLTGINNTLNSIKNLPSQVAASTTSGTLANPVSQAGATSVILTSLPSNYQGASVSYSASSSQTTQMLAAQTTAFQNGSTQASVVVSNTGVGSTYGGAIANPLPSSGVGSPSNPYLFSGGYQGAGFYQVSLGSPIISITSSSAYKQELANINAGQQVAPLQAGSSNLLPEWL